MRRRSLALAFMGSLLFLCWWLCLSDKENSSPPDSDSANKQYDATKAAVDEANRRAEPWRASLGASVLGSLALWILLIYLFSTVSTPFTYELDSIGVSRAIIPQPNGEEPRMVIDGAVSGLTILRHGAEIAVRVPAFQETCEGLASTPGVSCEGGAVKLKVAPPIRLEWNPAKPVKMRGDSQAIVRIDADASGLTTVLRGPIEICFMFPPQAELSVESPSFEEPLTLEFDDNASSIDCNESPKLLVENYESGDAVDTILEFPPGDLVVATAVASGTPLQIEAGGGVIDLGGVQRTVAVTESIVIVGSEPVCVIMAMGLADLNDPAETLEVDECGEAARVQNGRPWFQALSEGVSDVEGARGSLLPTRFERIPAISAALIGVVFTILVGLATPFVRQGLLYLEPSIRIFGKRRDSL